MQALRGKHGSERQAMTTSRSDWEAHIAEMELKRVTRIGKPTQEQKTQMVDEWNKGDVEIVKLGDIGHTEVNSFVDAVGGPSCKASVEVLRRPAPAKVTSIPTPESAVLKAVLAALRVHPRVAWAARINAGRFQVDGRWIQASFKGCADILGQLTNGILFACECKSDTGKTTEDQAAFLKVVADNYGISFVARSVDDVMLNIPTAKDAA